MPTGPLQNVRRLLLFAACALVCAGAARGQTACVSKADVQSMIERLNSQARAQPNDALRARLLKLREKDEDGLKDSIDRGGDAAAVARRVGPSRKESTEQVCSILKEFGWPGAALVGSDGAGAALYLIKNSSSVELQRTLLPVVVAATKKGDISRADFADFFDELRLGLGLKQLFGTQATVREGFLVLYPVEDEGRVDERRAQYGLAPLRQYIRALERAYMLPLVKAPGMLTKTYADTPSVALAHSAGGDTKERAATEDEVMRVDTNLVSLNVSVSSDRLRPGVATLAQNDFAVFEDGHEESVSFFATTEAPFDLVLLLDLSGSTTHKRDLIRKSTRRFIEAARPTDRLAVVLFADTVQVVSPLTADRKQLLDGVKKIDGNGGTRLWDALKYTLDNVIDAKAEGRRRAVVVMTDGVDNALGGYGFAGSHTEFSDLVETVRRGDTMIIPIYIDTEGGDPFSHKIYKSARDTLSMLADESGGLYYKARNFSDLSGVYEQVIEDLGKVYSIGYRPTNERRDGLWREVKVQVRNHPELTARTRRGYYAK